MISHSLWTKDARRPARHEVATKTRWNGDGGTHERTPEDVDAASARARTCKALVRMVAAFLAFASQAVAIDVPQREIKLPPRLQQALAGIDRQRYDVRPRPVREAPSATPTRPQGWSAFSSRYGEQWRLEVDSRTNAPLLVEGKGIAAIPGSGNDLRTPAFGPEGKRIGERFSVSDVATVVQTFIAQNAAFLGVDADNLVLDEKVSSGSGKKNRFWYLQYQQVVRDRNLGIIPVRGAHVFARITHGNLVQFGNQLVVAPSGIDTNDVISRERAVEITLDLLGNPKSPVIVDPVVDVGQPDRTLQIVPVNAPDGSLQHQLVRSLLVSAGDLDLELWFDAHSGELVNAIDRRLYVDASVRGGIFPTTNTDPEVLRSLPFVQVTNDGVDKDADLAGIYDYAPPNSLASAGLEGDYVSIDDTCGDSSVSTSFNPGDLSFGMGAGTDCDTPGFGGPGNSHAARSAYYHLNLAKEKGRRYLNDPVVTTPWLDAQLVTHVNVDDVCNAFWSPGTGEVTFFASGTNLSGLFCSNTGEIAGVFLHEYGHGLDQNTNGAPPENGSGEAYGDTMAFLQTHDPCIGDNFTPGTACSYGCAATCTGVRNVAVTPAVSPSTIETAPADCDRWTCPYFFFGQPYQGPMGYEGHCESLIASGAVWDMIQGFVGRYGDGAGWALGDRIWYESLYQTGSAYQVVAGTCDGGPTPGNACVGDADCAPGGVCKIQCNPAASVDGCGADNWYTVFLTLDDDNGDLTDGTPNADLIWDAFNAHGIACGAAAPPVSSTCPTIGAPTLTAVASTGQVQLSWTSVADADSYRVFRNAFGCDQGSTPIAEVTAPATTYTDTSVSNGTTYYYAVQAIGTNDVCVSQFSTCVSAAPTEPLTPADIFMVLDHSGSMSGTTDVAGEQKIDALHDAGQMVIDLVEDYAADGFRLGGVSFSTTATGTESLKNLSVPSQKTALENFVTALTPTDLTAIGQGINQALASFPASSTNEKVLMLLSDGIQNVPPMLELNSPPPGAGVGGTALPSDVRFYTVALGSNIQEDLFDDLSNLGGIPGFYYSGGTAEIKGNFAFWIADVLGLDPATPFAASGGGGFAAFSSASASGDAATTYTVNRSVRRVTFLVTWNEKGRDLRFHLETPMGRIDPPATSFHPDRGYASHTIVLPVRGRDPLAHVGEWKVVVEEGSNGEPGSGVPPFTTFALFDDPAISLEYEGGGADPGAGEPLPLELRVLENGNPLSGLSVKVVVDGPETGLGEILSEARVDARQLAKVKAGGGDRFPGNAWRKLAAMLEADPDVLKMLPGNVVVLPEGRPGIYQGSLPATKTEAAGTYVLTFEVEGEGIVNERFQRTMRFSRYLRVKPTPENTTVVAEALDARTVRFVVTPRDRADKRLGPGWGNYVKTTSNVGTQIGDVVDNLDGSYTLDLVVRPDQTGTVTIDVLGTRIDTPIPQPQARRAPVPWWVWLILLLLLLILFFVIRIWRRSSP